MSAHPTPPIGVSEVWASEELLDLTRRGVEVWRPVVGTDGWYDVSNLGRARTWIRQGCRTRQRAAEPSILAGNLQTTGYPTFQICEAGRRKVKLLHVAICEAFIGPRPGPALYWQGGHKNDVKTDNRLTNVRWCTNALNITERWENGKAGRSARPSQQIDGVTHYRCTKCDTWKPEADFGRLSKTLAPLSRCKMQSECRACSSARRRELRRRKVG